MEYFTPNSFRPKDETQTLKVSTKEEELSPPVKRWLEAKASLWQTMYRERQWGKLREVVESLSNGARVARNHSCRFGYHFLSDYFTNLFRIIDPNFEYEHFLEEIGLA